MTAARALLPGPGLKLCTPNLDAWDRLKRDAYDRTHCRCHDEPKIRGAESPTAHLHRYGRLCKRQTPAGWRRQWQCRHCLAHMPGDGINAGPPTAELPDYVDYLDPIRQVWLAEWLEAWKDAQDRLPPQRDAFFRDHDLYLKSDAWQILRAKVLLRDGGRCARCGLTAVNVHHLTYDRWQREDLRDLISLCETCHDAEHG